MTQNFRKTVMATTMLAGFAIFSIEAAQAKGPSLGSISGFSSMRMDFNRVGGPGRALSRDETRVVPLEVKKTIPSGIMPLPGKKDDKKNIARKKDTNVARVSNPKSPGGGNDKPGVQVGPNLQINPNVVAEQIDVAALAERIELGPLNVGNLVFPTPGFESPVEIPTTDQGTSDPDEIRKRAEGPGGAPGGPDTSKTGQASQDGNVSWIQSSSEPDGWRHTRSYDARTNTLTDRSSSPWSRNSDGSVSRNVTTTTTSLSGSGRQRHSNETENRAANDPEVEGGVKGGAANYGRVRESGNRPGPRNSTGGENQDQIVPVSNEETSGGENPPDSQPTEGYSARGMGRPASICGPGGCWVGDASSRRQILTRDPDGSTARTARRQSPGWGIDPNPDGLGGGSNGSYSGHRPTDEEGGDIGGGNPEAAGAAL